MITSQVIAIDQHNFRIILQAMSHPGRIFQLYDTEPNAFFAVIRALLDQEVSFWVSVEDIGLAQKIHAMTGSPVAQSSAADFLIMPGGSSFVGIYKAKRGTPEYPDQSATIIYDVEELSDDGNGNSLVLLTGPGIESELKLNAHGPLLNALLDLSVVNADFPLGVDSIFLDKGGRIMSIPRSTRIKVG